MRETYHAPTSERTAEFQQQGLITDETGRPLHPWIAEYGTDLPSDSPLWQWGPNAAADAIVLNTERPEVLLIQRRDGSWANAGGFVDADDKSTAHTAAREAFEEEGLKLNPSEGLPVYEGIVEDSRAGRYSWVTTAAFLWRTSIQLDTLSANDDAQAIRLTDLADVRAKPLYGSHSRLIDDAIERYGTLTEKLRYYGRELGTEPVRGGHMGYTHATHTTPTGQHIHTKRHNPDFHTEPDRAKRSRLYLQKEASVLDHLAANGYDSIPEHVDYHNGMLAMDAFTIDDGWKWRHPEDNDTQTRYINDTLTALDALAQIPSIDDTPDITPSIVSFLEEGWGTFDETSRYTITAMLHDYADTIDNADFADAARQLACNLDTLRSSAQSIDLDQPTVLCHHDFRESNFAWHSEQGVKIIDWSWAGLGPINADATTFLIDLHKRGVDVAGHFDHFNRDHALLLMGFWLAHGIRPSYGDTDVRFQQINSAVAAYDLIQRRETESQSDPQ